jgi:hypothetical protein
MLQVQRQVEDVELDVSVQSDQNRTRKFEVGMRCMYADVADWRSGNTPDAKDAEAEPQHM